LIKKGSLGYPFFFSEFKTRSQLLTTQDW
jgi:hypothetical protein